MPGDENQLKSIFVKDSPCRCNLGTCPVSRAVASQVIRHILAACLLIRVLLFYHNFKEEQLWKFSSAEMEKKLVGSNA